LLPVGALLLGFVPWLNTFNDRIIRHSWTPSSVVLDITNLGDQDRFPKDERGVDMLIYTYAYGVL